MLLNVNEFRKKVLGCWMGKNIGGTLGAPFEWQRQVNDVSFYTQDLKGEALPNDDLDIQLLWLVAMEERGVDIDTHLLAEYWVDNVTPHWAEYGTGKVNMRSGLMPPLSGTRNNHYKDSCGAFIRSEIWACTAPGCPKIAARNAYEDAIIDHGDGEGVYAEVFCAALEAAAFVQSDIQELIRIGLSYIPEDCGVAQAIGCAIDCHKSGKTWREAREEMLEKYRGASAANNPAFTSAEDIEKGFHEGRLGWDVPSNIGILLIGLLYGEGDFGKTLCTAVNCGEDTDCTGATAGAIFGIIHGIDGIPEKWIEPIGRGIKTMTLNIGDLGAFWPIVPQDVDNLTTRTEALARQMIMRHRLPVAIDEQPSAVGDPELAALHAGAFQDELYANLGAPVVRGRLFDVGVHYGEGGPTIQEGVTKRITLKVINRYRNMMNVNYRWLLPEGWMVSPDEGSVYVHHAGLNNIAEIECDVTAEMFIGKSERLAVELTVDGRPTVELVPVILLRG